MREEKTVEQKSREMARVRSVNTKPELKLRSLLRAGGIRGYKIAPGNVKGRPDLCFMGKKVAVFVDGCFWHGCPKCYRAPKRGAAFWAGKREGNEARDRLVDASLAAGGWQVLRVWEHELSTKAGGDDVVRRVAAALSLSSAGGR